MKRMILICISLLFFAVLVACNDDTNEKEVEQNAAAVETVAVKEGNLVIERSINGRIAADSITPIIVEQPGEVDELKVKNGDQVKKDERIATIKTPMGNQHIEAKKAGEIASLSVKEGDLASGEDPLALILDLEKLVVTVSVTSDVRSLFKLDKKLDTVIDNKVHEAKIIEIDKLPNDTGLYDIELVVDNKDDKLIPGMIATVRVPEQRIDKALLLPTEAIVEELEGTYIYTVKDNLAKKIEVSIIESQSDQTAIEGDINEGDEVVINGQLILSDGSEVDVVEKENES